ncbi:MAG: leucyl/phenylalanyl-tRNA--protein transferase [Proteobacteria bacterium]|nr:leucyl/phenylalanyl-tRNA--protein transferase [Pseudomonadota bacterium]
MPASALHHGVKPLICFSPFGRLRLPDFPEALCHTRHGMVAFGGDYEPVRLFNAYRRGIFPWPRSPQEPVYWFCPSPRFVLLPEALHIPKSLRRVMRQTRYEIRIDTAFRAVMTHCAQVNRPDCLDGSICSWITPDMIEGYVRLHELGHAHSVETWLDGELIGGLYGVSVGRVFCGESMFALKPDASKVAFASFAMSAKAAGFVAIDCQAYTEHLARFGAQHMPRKAYLKLLMENRDLSPMANFWQTPIPVFRDT